MASQSPQQQQQQQQQASNTSLPSYFSSPPSPNHLPDHLIATVSPPNAVPHQSHKRSRDVYEVAIVSPSSSGALANQPIEVIDLVSEDNTPPMFPPFKRQKLESRSSYLPISPSPPPISLPPLSLPSSSPPAPAPPAPPASPSRVNTSSSGETQEQEQEPEVIDLTGDQTTESSDSESTWSQSSSSSSSSDPARSGMVSPATFYPPAEVLLPPKGPNPLGNDWEELGPLDEFPEDPLMASYEPPASYPFPAGVSSDIISANPEVAFLFHVKSVGAERYDQRPLSSGDSLCFVPTALSTTFFMSIKMDIKGMKRLKRDMAMARQMGFLPFRNEAAAMNAVNRYSRMNWRRYGNPEMLDGVVEVTREDECGDPLYLAADWYPGHGHYRRMIEEWMDSHPNIRGTQGVPGFAGPEEWGTREPKVLRKFNWGKWEVEGLKGR
ncbi:hypothetical protein TWF506_000516 [Arthrobotrys conoides]|uniref:Uncharacterized protein n=1 Tax=Arthrobotrys conoides TaxID=74498 RepID=A0AAN8NFU0_9PEZI